MTGPGLRFAGLSFLNHGEGQPFDRRSLFRGLPAEKQPRDRRELRDQVARSVAGVLTPGDRGRSHHPWLSAAPSSTGEPVGPTTGALTASPSRRIRLRGQADRGPAQGDQGTGQRGLIGQQRSADCAAAEACASPPGASAGWAQPAPEDSGGRLGAGADAGLIRSHAELSA